MKLIRNGRLVADPLKGVDTDKLSKQQKADVLEVIKKNRDGHRLDMKDVRILMKARRASPPAKANSLQAAADALERALETARAMR